jgi:acyl carrier protein
MTPAVAGADAAPQTVERRVLEIVRTLVDELGGLKGRGPVALDDALDRDLGLGSLERVELVVRIEQGLRIPAAGCGDGRGRDGPGAGPCGADGRTGDDRASRRGSWSSRAAGYRARGGRDSDGGSRVARGGRPPSACTSC